ncbi:MAG: hypothetical protein Q8K51_08965 [Nitrospirota bacterium]|nr:hypothetical protein [Nitrospirota bacterium]
MKKILLIGILVLAAFVVTACATGSANTPLPQTLSIEQPMPDTPKEIAGYIGIWEGVWSSESQGYYHENVLPVTIVIEQIKSSRVRAIYSWGNWDTYIKEGHKRMSGEIKNNTLILKDSFGVITIDINASNPTIASATMRSNTFTATTTLRKKDIKDLQLGAKRDIAHLPEKIRAYNGTWKGYFDNGTPITEDIQVISEKKVIVTHSWEDNPSRLNVKAGSWTRETGFNKDGSIFVINGNRLLTIKLNKDGTLNVGLEPTDGGWYVSGDLKKIE